MEIFQYQFFQNAVIAAVLASIACGVIGSFVIVKRLTFISGGIAHAAFGGIGLGYFLGVSPILCLIPTSLLAALGIGYLSKHKKANEDTAIGIFWAVGMALGVILIGLTPGYAPDLFSYLFGNILMVPRGDLWLILLLDCVILGIVFLLYKELLALCFDETGAKILGLPADALYYLLLALIALTVTILVRIVGIVLVIALLTIPAAVAKQFTSGFVKMMIAAIILGVVFTLSGLWLSYVLDQASGATIILVSGAVFALTSLFKAGKSKFTG